MMRAGRPLQWLVTLVAMLLIAGCAHFTGASNQINSKDPLWEGRLLVKVQGASPQSFSASFALQGSASRGHLALYTPLGTTAAQIRWDETSAQLQTNEGTSEFASLAELTLQLTGAALPVTSLFAWLQGVNEAAPGWTVDLDELPQGRLRAQRFDDPAPVQLLVVLER